MFLPVGLYILAGQQIGTLKKNSFSEPRFFSEIQILNKIFPEVFDPILILLIFVYIFIFIYYIFYLEIC